MTTELTVVYNTPKGEVKLTPAIIKKYLVRGDATHITDQEVAFFMKLCEFQQLNPWLNEAYIIKYGSSPATLVTGIEAFLKRANRNPKFQGHIVTCTGEVPDLTATAKVHVKDFTVPITVTVEYKEYVGKKGDGTVNKIWAGKPKTMIKKVALAQALRQAFPEDLGGLYTEEESGEGLDNKPPTSADKLMEKFKEQGGEKTDETLHPEADAGSPQSDTTAPPAEELINAAQLKKLHVVLGKNDLGVKEKYLEYFRDEYGIEVESSKEITKAQAIYIIDQLDNG